MIIQHTPTSEPKFKTRMGVAVRRMHKSIVLLLLLLLLLLVVAYLLMKPIPAKQTGPLANFQASNTARAGPGSGRVVDPIELQKMKKIDSLAETAPFHTNVSQQQKAWKILNRLLTMDPLQRKCNDTLDTAQSRKYCNEPDFQVKPPCLVYSFGIAYDFGVDDHFGKKGCDVFSFDPSMNKPDHRRSRQVMFYQMGLGAEDTDDFVPRLDSYVKKRTTWRVRTLKSFMAMLNHSRAVIDILKIDVECSEWASIRNMLDTGVTRQVKQILVEWHIFNNCPARERFPWLISILNDLYKAGFRSFYRRSEGRQLNWADLRLQHDYAYLNVQFIHH